MKSYHLNLILTITLTALSAINAGRGHIALAFVSALLALLNFVIYIGRRASDVDTDNQHLQ